jgi:ribosomal protein S12 methylthiotransferase accessory factor
MQLFGQTWAQPKTHARGTHRGRHPDDTWAQLSPLAPRLGVTRVARLTGLDTIGLPVWTAIRPNARGLSAAQGKGLHDACARVSALMEAVECWHAENVLLPLRQASAHELAQADGTAAVADLAGLAGHGAPAERTRRRTLWLPADELVAGGRAWLPLDAVSTDYTGSAGSGLLRSSNGLAGGNSVLEATVHALCELVERDAVALGDLAMRRVEPALRIRPETVDDEACQGVLAQLARAGLWVALFDLRSDLGLPVCGATIIDAPGQRSWRALPAFNGYGCHLSPRIALLRALTEAVQSRLTHISGSRDDILPGDYRRAGHPDEIAALQQRLATQPATLDFATLPELGTPSFEGDLALIVQRLRDAGLGQVLVADLRHAALGVPVVRAVVPGLLAPLPLVRAHGLQQRQRPGACAWHEAATHPNAAWKEAA